MDSMSTASLRLHLCQSYSSLSSLYHHIVIITIIYLAKIQIHKNPQKNAVGKSYQA